MSLKQTAALTENESLITERNTLFEYMKLCFLSLVAFINMYGCEFDIYTQRWMTIKLILTRPS
jgi:hypothetical protein